MTTITITIPDWVLVVFKWLVATWIVLEAVRLGLVVNAAYWKWRKYHFKHKKEALRWATLKKPIAKNWP